MREKEESPGSGSGSGMRGDGLPEWPAEFQSVCNDLFRVAYVWRDSILDTRARFNMAYFWNDCYGYFWPDLILAIDKGFMAINRLINESIMVDGSWLIPSRPRSRRQRKHRLFQWIHKRWAFKLHRDAVRLLNITSFEGWVQCNVRGVYYNGAVIIQETSERHPLLKATLMQGIRRYPRDWKLLFADLTTSRRF